MADSVPIDDLYPEHAKLAAVTDQSQAIGAFLDNGHYVLAEYRELDGWHEPQLVPVSKNIQQILAEHFEIDLTKIESEKRAMIAALSAAD